MDWSNEDIMKFLKLYQMHPCIWDPKERSHKNRDKLNSAWIDIQKNMGPLCTVKELKKKRESLMCAFRGYKRKIKKSETLLGSELYHPTWFAYEYMNSFLGTIYKCKPASNYIENNPHQDAGDLNTCQSDIDATKAASNPKQESHDGTLASKETSRWREKHNNDNSVELLKKQMENNNILKRVDQLKHNIDKDENESSIFGQLVAIKIRTFVEDRRELMMWKINQLFYNEKRHHTNKCHSSSSTLMEEPNNLLDQLEVKIEPLNEEFVEEYHGIKIEPEDKIEEEENIHNKTNYYDSTLLPKCKKDFDKEYNSSETADDILPAAIFGMFVSTELQQLSLANAQQAQAKIREVLMEFRMIETLAIKKE